MFDDSGRSASVARMTLGMRLDALISSLDHLSSTQLYALIVFATVGLCLVVLGTGSHEDDDHVVHQPSAAASSSSPVKPANSHASTAGPQPRFWIFKYVNVAVSLVFLASILQFAFNASDYMEHLNTFLVGWSVLLCYFFGFFGVSLIHTDLLVEGSATHRGTSGTHAPAAANTIPSGSSASAPMLNKKIQPPSSCTPVCADPSSFQVTPSNPSILTNSNSIKDLPDAEIAQLVLANIVKDHELEKRLDPFRAVEVRRLAATEKLRAVLPQSNSEPHFNPLANLPFQPSLDYSRVHGANCETVIGYVPLPVGMVGPLTLNSQSVYVPMATTEGCLVASTNRGAKAISQGGGCEARVVKDGITRAPCVRMASAMEAADLKLWCETPSNFAKLQAAFESTTSFGKLLSCQPTIAGRNVYLRLVCFAGDAMGMNMVSKGSLAVIELLQSEFPSLTLVALSGNMCTDKKAAATNWLHGRGKSVVVEATIPQAVVKSTLKTTVPALVHTNLHKNLIGSAMAGAIGGFNAHASNIVTAIFLATGQDPAQNVESSNCITLMEETPEGDLWISCTMPSLEVGTVGGGTSLEAQKACLSMMGVAGGGPRTSPGAHAKQLAMIVAGATMAGELSLLAALAANTLVQAHMQHNRKPVQSPGAVLPSK